MKKADLNVAKEWFLRKDFVRKEELNRYLFDTFSISERNTRFAIKQLVEAGICFQWRKDVYRPVGDRFVFRPGKSDGNLKDILEEFPYPVPICIGNGAEVNRFTELQAFSPRTILYAPRILRDELASYLLSKGFYPIVLRKHMREYTTPNTVFLSGLNWRTPLDRNGSRLSSFAEKALVCYSPIEKNAIDVLSGDYGMDESLAGEVIKSILMHYAYNASVMESYARDRGREERLRNLILSYGLEVEFYER